VVAGAEKEKKGKAATQPTRLTLMILIPHASFISNST